MILKRRREKFEFLLPAWLPFVDCDVWGRLRVLLSGWVSSTETLLLDGLVFHPANGFGKATGWAATNWTSRRTTTGFI
jgi:hypothetical protein